MPKACGRVGLVLGCVRRVGHLPCPPHLRMHWQVFVSVFCLLPAGWCPPQSMSRGPPQGLLSGCAFGVDSNTAFWAGVRVRLVPPSWRASSSLEVAPSLFCSRFPFVCHRTSDGQFLCRWRGLSGTPCMAGFWCLSLPVACDGGQCALDPRRAGRRRPILR